MMTAIDIAENARKGRRVSRLDEKAMEIYLGEKCTLTQAYEKAKMLKEMPEGFEKLFGF